MNVDWSDPETLWLNVTNAVLGIVTVAALLTVVGAAVAEVWAKLRKRATEPADYHAFHVPDLGLTMADGGEKVDVKEEKPHRN